MNSEFATTVAVAVPVILLALGAEARELDKRTRAQRDWPSSFNAKWYSEAEQALESFPDASPDWTAEQLRTQLVHYQQWRGQWVRDRGSSPIFLLGTLQLRVYLATVLWALTIASRSPCASRQEPPPGSARKRRPAAVSASKPPVTSA